MSRLVEVLNVSYSTQNVGEHLKSQLPKLIYFIGFIIKLENVDVSISLVFDCICWLVL